jgi:hypothetical protein
MMRTSVPGNEGGFALLEALFCLFIAALLVIFIAGTVSLVLGISSRTFAEGISIIEDRNIHAPAGRDIEGRVGHAD